MWTCAGQGGSAGCVAYSNHLVGTKSAVLLPAEDTPQLLPDVVVRIRKVSTQLIVSTVTGSGWSRERD